MARVRQARKCSAHRKDGEPRGSYAMLGGDVCRMHGGASRQARHAAYVRQTEADILRQFNREWERWQKELREWQAKRILVAAELLGISPTAVTPMEIGFCAGWYGKPESLDAAPKMRRDRRFGPRKPWKGARRPPGVKDDQLELD